MRLAPPHPTLEACASAFPERRVGREESTRVLQALFPHEDPGFVADLVERSGIEERRVVREPEEVLSPSDFTERNRRYREEALALATRAARAALEAAAVGPAEVDAILDVSCTGVSLPALDVGLVPALGLGAGVRRIPITESGCAAGALALGTAAQLAQAGLTVLVVAVELASLTFCHDDPSRTNLVASALFGDGAAAAVVRPGGRGPRFLATGSHLLPGTVDLMGFDVGSHGLRILLRRELPFVLVRHLEPVLRAFLEEHDRRLAEVDVHLVHPGGRRILDAYEELFRLAPDDLTHSRSSLASYGNLSSVSILTVLERWLGGGRGEALLCGIGPGLSIELSLLGPPTP